MRSPDVWNKRGHEENQVSRLQAMSLNYDSGMVLAGRQAPAYGCVRVKLNGGRGP